MPIWPPDRCELKPLRLSKFFWSVLDYTFITTRISKPFWPTGWILRKLNLTIALCTIILTHRKTSFYNNRESSIDKATLFQTQLQPIFELTYIHKALHSPHLTSYRNKQVSRTPLIVTINPHRIHWPTCTLKFIFLPDLPPPSSELAFPARY